MTGIIRRIMMMIVAAGCLSSPAFPEDLPQWIKKLKISGDLGARTEIVNDEKAVDPNDRVRERARLRLWFDTTPVDKVSVSFGVETSGTNPTSAWADYTDFQNQPLYLAHAYLQYKPSEHLTVSGGKLKSSVPFWKPTQLVWKNDVNPYGVSANIEANAPGNVKFFTNAGLYVLTEYRDYQRQMDIPTNAIVIVQPGLDVRKGNFSAKGAVAIQQFSLVNHSQSGWIKANHSFSLINPSWEVSFTKESYGISFNGEYSDNVNASVERDTHAYLFSLGFGSNKIDRFKEWQVKAAYRRVETNAIPLGFGNTSAYNADPGKGWEYFLGFGLLKDLVFNATFYDMTDLAGNRPQLVSQLDVIYRF